MLYEGMYVRCPIDNEYPDLPRDFIMGKILEINEIAETAIVKFEDPFYFKNYYEFIPDELEYTLTKLKHCTAYKGAYVYYGLKKCIVVSYSKKDDWFYYYIQQDDTGEIKYVREDEIEIPFACLNVSPVYQLAEYEFQNPIWYIGNYRVSKTMNILDSSIYGLKELAGCKIHLMMHQLKTILRSVQENEIRLMLADEVGMGKTIEAAAILKLYLLKNRKKKVLIAVPDSLLEQWRVELFLKFGIEAGFDANKNKIQIISTEKLGIHSSQEWDFIIIDEVHNTLKNKILYDDCHRISRNASNILLLSATPIQQREEDYLMLLRLILPTKYDSMNLSDFVLLTDKQKKINKLVYNVLVDYEDYMDSYNKAVEQSENPADDEDCQDLLESMLDGLDSINRLIKDDIFAELIEEISDEIEAETANKLQAAFLYVTDNYQIEKCIIRSRRKLIENEVSKRSFKEIPYAFDESLNPFEYAAYESLIDFLSSEPLNEQVFKEIYIPVISAFFSSAKAYNSEIAKASQKGVEFSETVKKLAVNWLKHENSIASTITSVLQKPYNYNERMVHIVDYIDQEVGSGKVVLFTDFEDTFELYSTVLESYFGKEHVALFGKIRGALDNELAIYRFQNDEECNILLCDHSGGEGRNLQNADMVIHIDLPWDANTIEQRIGRLDRLGRDISKDAVSVIVHTKSTLEEELFKFWNEGLNVFTKSLSGLEIIMSEINASIISALVKDFKYGATSAIEDVIRLAKKMETEIKQEQLFDSAAYLYGTINQRIKLSLNNFQKNENEYFAGAMLSWASLAGFNAISEGPNKVSFSELSFSTGSAARSLFIPPKWAEYSNTSKAKFIDDVVSSYESHKKMAKRNTIRTIRGTFDRNLAIGSDYLHFFAPGDEVFDSIVNNALHSDKGKCAGFCIKADFEWRGLIYIVELQPDLDILIENNVPLSILSQFKNYMPVDRVVIPIPFKKYTDIDKRKVVAFLDSLTSTGQIANKNLTAHLGRRSPKNDFLQFKNKYKISNLDAFKTMYPEEAWVNLVKQTSKLARNEALTIFKKSSTFKLAEKEVSRMINANIARAHFYGMEEEAVDSMVQKYNIVLESLKKSKTSIESAAFLWMVNSSDYE